jgi:hypothetical protein
MRPGTARLRYNGCAIRRMSTSVWGSARRVDRKRPADYMWHSRQEASSWHPQIPAAVKRAYALVTALLKGCRLGPTARHLHLWAFKLFNRMQLNWFLGYWLQTFRRVHWAAKCSWIMAIGVACGIPQIKILYRVIRMIKPSETVGGSGPIGVIEFLLPNCSSRSLAPGLTLPFIEIGTRRCF